MIASKPLENILLLWRTFGLALKARAAPLYQSMIAPMAREEVYSIC